MLENEFQKQQAIENSQNQSSEEGGEVIPLEGAALSAANSETAGSANRKRISVDIQTDSAGKDQKSPESGIPKTVETTDGSAGKNLEIYQELNIRLDGGYKNSEEWTASNKSMAARVVGWIRNKLSFNNEARFKALLDAQRTEMEAKALTKTQELESKIAELSAKLENFEKNHASQQALLEAARVFTNGIENAGKSISPESKAAGNNAKASEVKAPESKAENKETGKEIVDIKDTYRNGKPSVETVVFLADTHMNKTEADDSTLESLSKLRDARNNNTQIEKDDLNRVLRVVDRVKTDSGEAIDRYSAMDMENDADVNDLKAVVKEIEAVQEDFGNGEKVEANVNLELTRFNFEVQMVKLLDVNAVAMTKDWSQQGLDPTKVVTVARAFQKGEYNAGDLQFVFKGFLEPMATKMPESVPGLPFNKNDVVKMRADVQELYKDRKGEQIKK